MQDNFVGLQLNGTAIIGQQPNIPAPPLPIPPYHGNRWIPGSFGSGFGAVNFNVNQPGSLTNSLFTTRSVVSGGLQAHNPFITNASPNIFGVDNSGWFNPQPLGNTFSCAQLTICNEQIAGGGEGERELLLLIAKDSTLTVDYVPESKSMARQVLYEALQNDSTLSANDSTLQAFEQTHTSSSVGYLYDAKQLLSYVGQLDSIGKSTVLTADSLVHVYCDNFYYLDSLEQTDSSFNYTQQKESLKLQIESELQIIRNVMEELRIVDSLNMHAATIKNNMATSAELPLFNEKLINEIMLNYYSTGKESLLMLYNDLLYIAHQCPYAGGSGVIRARILLSIINDSIIYDDQTVCNQAGYYRISNIQTKNNLSTSDIRIKPNPANSSVEIELLGNHNGICKLAVLDALGKTQIIQQYECENKNHKIDLQKLQPGIYFISVQVNNQITHYSKLIIAR